jgi:hypothetical protein
MESDVSSKWAELVNSSEPVASLLLDPNSNQISIHEKLLTEFTFTDVNVEHRKT